MVLPGPRALIGPPTSASPARLGVHRLHRAARPRAGSAFVQRPSCTSTTAGRCASDRLVRHRADRGHARRRAFAASFLHTPTDDCACSHLGGGAGALVGRRATDAPSPLRGARRRRPGRGLRVDRGGLAAAPSEPPTGADVHQLALDVTFFVRVAASAGLPKSGLASSACGDQGGTAPGRRLPGRNYAYRNGTTSPSAGPAPRPSVLLALYRFILFRSDLDGVKRSRSGDSGSRTLGRGSAVSTCGHPLIAGLAFPSCAALLGAAARVHIALVRREAGGRSHADLRVGCAATTLLRAGVDGCGRPTGFPPGVMSPSQRVGVHVGVHWGDQRVRRLLMWPR